jgi:hypothetical protein
MSVEIFSLSDLSSKGYVIDSEIAIPDVSILVLEQFDSIMTAPYIRWIFRPHLKFQLGLSEPINHSLRILTHQSSSEFFVDVSTP